MTEELSLLLIEKDYLKVIQPGFNGTSLTIELKLPTFKTNGKLRHSDTQRFTFNLENEELEKMIELLKDKDIVAYSDGFSFDFPAAAGSGVAFYEKKGNKELYLCGAYMSLGKVSNNYAEYFGLILAQTLLSIFGVNNPSFKTDSMILVTQFKANKISGTNFALFEMIKIMREMFGLLGDQI